MSVDNEKGRGSTRWVARASTLPLSAAGKTQRGRRPHRWFGCYPWPRDQKITLTVRYKGGGECWYLIEARGRHGVFPGVAALHDVMREIHGQR